MNKEELINALELAKAEVEWDQKLTCIAAIDEAIKYINALDTACELLVNKELYKDKIKELLLK